MTTAPATRHSSSFRYENDRDMNACVVAQLIGFDLARRFEGLPVGFRVNWTDATDAGHFEGCKTFGDLLRGYCAYLSRHGD